MWGRHVVSTLGKRVQIKLNCSRDLTWIADNRQQFPSEKSKKKEVIVSRFFMGCRTGIGILLYVSRD